MLEEVRGYVMRILARNKKAFVGYHGRITLVQQSRLEMEKKESNYWRPFPSGDEDGNVYEVQRLPVKTGHNSRGCDKKKEAMASGRAAAGSGSQHQGAAATTEGMAVDDLDEDVNVDDLNCVNPFEEPMAVRPLPSNSSTAYVPPRPIMNSTMSKRPIRRKNVKRPPPSQPSPLRPAPPQPTPITPTTPQPSVVRPASPTNQPPPKVTKQTMHGASQGTTTRFMRFMPTPPSTIQTAGRWPALGFRPPPGASSSSNNNGVSSGSNNSTPNK
nr:proline-rich receptor-like protein kinase PERK9 [Arachis hypogaea]